MIMNKTNNRRVQMTKRILKETLLELLEKTDISRISVRTLCEGANVNRSTFYKHYSSQYEIYDEMQQDFLLQIEKCFQCSNGERLSYEEALIKKLTYMKENLRLCKILIGNHTASDFQTQLLNVPYIQQEMAADFCRGNETEIKYKKEFIISGCFRIIVRWIDDNCPESPEQLSSIILGLLNNVI